MSTGKFDNIPDKAVFYEKDINEDLNDIFEKHDIKAVFHFAARIMVQDSIENPSETHEVIQTV